MRLKDRVAIVTGGNSGIGRGIVHRFVEEGARVAIAGRDAAKGAKVLHEVEEMGGEAVFFPVELGEEKAVEHFVTDVAERFEAIDIVVNNAGVGGRRAEVAEGDAPGVRWDKLRGPNLDSAYFVSAYALPHLAASGRGAIVNVSSTATWHGNWGLYCVAKAGVEGLTRMLAAEGGPSGVRANCVSPGWTATERDAEAPPAGDGDGWAMPPSLLGRMGTTAELAAAVLFLASDDASFVTGQTLIVDGGLMVTDYPSMSMLEGIKAKLMTGKV